MLEAPDTSLYGAAASLLAVLIVAGVLGEWRLVRDRLKGAQRDGEGGDALSSGEWAAVWMFALALLASLVGEGVSLSVLADPREGEWEPIVVVSCIGLALVLVVVSAILPVLHEVLKEKGRPRGLRIAIGLAVLVALLGSYAVIGATKSETEPAYRVYGTCGAGKCGLNVRARPTTAAKRLGQLRDGDRIDVVCQTIGESMRAPNGTVSKVWNKLKTGGYVSDLHVDTQRVGGFSPGLSRC